MIHTPQMNAAHAAIDLQEVGKFVDRFDNIEDDAANLAALIHLVSRTDDLEECVQQALSAIGDLAYKLKADTHAAARGFSVAMGHDS